MWEIIALPFKILFGALSAVWHVAWGLISMMFSLVGGVFSLVIWVMVIALIVGIIGSLCSKNNRHRDNRPEREDFVSYYDHNAVK